MLLELAAEPSPVAVCLRFTLHDDPRERGRIVGKDVARVEQLLVEELKASEEGKISLFCLPASVTRNTSLADSPRGASRSSTGTRSYTC